MKVTVNDEAVEVDDETTVAALLERLGLGPKGIAVAVDLSVLPRSEWQTTLADGVQDIQRQIGKRDLLASRREPPAIGQQIATARRAGELW